MYIKLNDTDKGLLERISDKMSIPLDVRLIDSETWINTDNLIEFIDGMEEKYDELYEIYTDFENEVQENWVKKMEDYEYGE